MKTSREGLQYPKTLKQISGLFLFFFYGFLIQPPMFPMFSTIISILQKEGL